MADNKDVKFHEEIQKMEYEPMDETELKLIKGGITLGVVLLVVLFIISKFVIGAH
ncbi:bacteriocin-type signal sequence [uncultured Bilophila sp.]|uniref:bacteriocin-type signal sequence n=1 Tax=uncultured Bilophila sp. TaxID=529385 RepID=UPI0025E06955|nr:bacteriocin-type signal sequence [uncultured Bilophila sp.]